MFPVNYYRFQYDDRFLFCMFHHALDCKDFRTRYQANIQIRRISDRRQSLRVIERFRYKATKAKMVQSKIKQLDKLEIIEEPKKTNNKTFKFDINPSSESGKEVLNVMDLEIGYNKVLSKIDLR